ncbi:hypothetical protein RND81_05G049700 [Saponaria officinalis]|uniref:Uncharacterized protein n=1 Tax=Saponaria officinalis TaxID=3572 RepID=A0AAW1KTT9_SAPOF
MSYYIGISKIYIYINILFRLLNHPLSTYQALSLHRCRLATHLATISTLYTGDVDHHTCRFFTLFYRFLPSHLLSRFTLSANQTHTGSSPTLSFFITPSILTLATLSPSIFPLVILRRLYSILYALRIL